MFFENWYFCFRLLTVEWWLICQVTEVDILYILMLKYVHVFAFQILYTESYFYCDITRMPPAASLLTVE